MASKFGGLIFNQRDPEKMGTVDCLMHTGSGTNRSYYLLTCAHVLAGRSDTEKGDPIVWKDFEGEDLVVGELRRWTTRNRNDNALLSADAALVEIKPELAKKILPKINLPTQITGQISIGDKVSIHGGNSQKSYRLTIVDSDFAVPEGFRSGNLGLKYRYFGTMLCAPTNGSPINGDSGSAVFDQQGRLVGVYFLGATDSDGNPRAAFFPIEKIRLALNHEATGFEPIVLTRANIPADWASELAIEPPAPAEEISITEPSTPVTTEPTAEIELDDLSNDHIVLAKTLWGEARGEGEAGQIAVAAVILNRLRQNKVQRFGGTIAEVCQKPLQFSCWNVDDPNLGKMNNLTTSDRDYAACLNVARRAIAGELVDPTNSSDHYHHTNITASWSNGHTPAKTIGHHNFYNDIS